nr:hypothetical protein HK105_003153 [Polyrhizophydium stewartii]
MPAAAESGSLDCMIWVHDVVGQEFSADAFNTACRCGHEHIVKYLLDEANVPLPIFKWLHKNSVYFSPHRGLVKAVEEDKVDSVRWLCETFDMQVMQGLFEQCCRQKSKPLVLYMLGRPEVEITQGIVEAAAPNSVDVLDLLLARKPEMVQVAADAAAEGNVADILDWLHTRYPGCITQSTLAAAVKGKAKRAVEYLLETVHDVEWDLAAIKQIETSDEVAGLIDRHMNSRR